MAKAPKTGIEARAIQRTTRQSPYKMRLVIDQIRGQRVNDALALLRFSKKQLETLRNDVKNSFYSEEEFSGYFNTESQSIAKLVDATDELKSKYEMSDTRFTKFKPLAKGIIDSIKTVIYGSEPVSK